MPEFYQINILPDGMSLQAEAGSCLYDTLRREGLIPLAFCGGSGKCGKCAVLVDDSVQLACHTVIDRNMTVTLPDRDRNYVPADLFDFNRNRSGGVSRYAAFDIGTTTLVCTLLDETGSVLAEQSILNPQASFGADVISRLRSALGGSADTQARLIRQAMNALLVSVCSDTRTAPDKIEVISVVGNPTMQQFFLGIPVDNLAAIPFAPKITHTSVRKAAEFFPLCPQADLLTVPDVSGYIGADTVACVLSEELYKSDELSLLIDVGTNGEIVLGNKGRMLTCSCAAGPALEGAGIRFGMRSAVGAIDHVYDDNGQFRCHVIGDSEAVGICGSGLIDAVAVMLDRGLLDKRGKLPDGEPVYLTDSVYLTQEDIRAVQLTKAAIAAGISLLLEQYGVTEDSVQHVYLAGAFGSFMDPASACRIGLIPSGLFQKIKPVGNAAGRGAQLMARDRKLFTLTDTLVSAMDHIELASLSGFRREFARQMYFNVP